MAKNSFQDFDETAAAFLHLLQRIYEVESKRRGFAYWLLLVIVISISSFIAGVVTAALLFYHVILTFISLIKMLFASSGITKITQIWRGHGA